jgi:tetratricopeptide (TPR) repeat protein
MRAAPSSFEIADTPTVAGTCSGDTKKGRSLLGDAGSRFISRADRARDSRDWVSAARYYQKALEQKSDNPPIWVQYGHALKESGKLQEAEAAYRRSLELAPDVADTHLQLGHVLKIQGRKIEASTAYLRALVLDPGMDHASFELRNLGWTRGRIQFALRRELSGRS